MFTVKMSMCFICSLRNVQCSGSEQTLGQCSAVGAEQSNCATTESVFLICGQGARWSQATAVQRKATGKLVAAGNGPVAFVLDYLNQSLLKTSSAETQAKLTSLGHLNAIGTLYIALAGLMNVVVILDAFAGPDRRDDGPTRRSTDQ